MHIHHIGFYFIICTEKGTYSIQFRSSAILFCFNNIPINVYLTANAGIALSSQTEHVKYFYPPLMSMVLKINVTIRALKYTFDQFNNNSYIHDQVSSTSSLSICFALFPFILAPLKKTTSKYKCWIRK